jgi:hypothetical protein
VNFTSEVLTDCDAAEETELLAGTCDAAALGLLVLQAAAEKINAAESSAAAAVLNHLFVIGEKSFTVGLLSPKAEITA